MIHVACWNVLADCYTPSSCMTWKDRKRLLTAVLEATVVQHHTSLLLLQEVDHLTDFFRPVLTSLGLQVLFVQRPDKEDGCLIAFNDRQLELIAEEVVDFDDLARASVAPSAAVMDNCKQHTFLRHNVSLLAYFRCRATSRRLTVANTHHYWNPNFPEVKAGQVKYLMDRVGAFQQHWDQYPCPSPRPGVEPGSDASDTAASHHTPSCVLLGGDFNSLPTSEVYSLLTSSFQCAAVCKSVCKSRSTSISPHEESVPQAARRYLLPSKYLSCDEVGGDGRDETRLLPSFICDDTLSKFCRWLRLLGVSCTLLKRSGEYNGNNSALRAPSNSNSNRNRNRNSSNTCVSEGEQLVTDLEGSLVIVEEEEVDKKKDKNTSKATRRPAHSSPSPSPSPSPSAHSSASTSASTSVSDKQLHKAAKTRQKTLQNNAYFSEITALARSEGRVLLTTNKQWQQRADMPESFFVDCFDLSSSVVTLFGLYRLSLDEDKFLTICGKFCSIV